MLRTRLRITLLHFQDSYGLFNHCSLHIRQDTSKEVSERASSFDLICVLPVNMSSAAQVSRTLVSWRFILKRAPLTLYTKRASEGHGWPQHGAQGHCGVCKPSRSACK